MKRVNHLKLIQEGHERIMTQLDKLEKVIQEISVSPFPLKALRINRKKLSSFFHFVETVGTTHRHYESDTLYPLIGSSLPGASHCDRGLLNSLETEHRDLETEVRERSDDFEKLLEEGSCQPWDCWTFCAELLALVRRFEHHIWKEKQILYPLLAAHANGKGKEVTWSSIKS